MRDELPRRLPFDLGAERSVARLRLASAAAVLPAALYLLATPQPLPAKVFGFLGLLVALGWAASFARTRARVARHADDFLELSEDGLVIARGGERTTLAWTSAVDIDVDEERLIVVIRKEDGTDIEIPPVWEGAGLDELCSLLRRWRDGATRPLDG